MKKRSERLFIPVTPDEKKRIASVADAREQTIAEITRAAVMRFVARVEREGKE